MTRNSKQINKDTYKLTIPEAKMYHDAVYFCDGELLDENGKPYGFIARGTVEVIPAHLNAIGCKYK